MRRRAAAGAFVGVLATLTAAWAAPAAPVRPTAPPAHAETAQEHALPPSTLLMEVSTGQVLAAEDPHRRVPPASLSKLMTLYLTLQAIQARRLSPGTRITVSAEAWRVGRTRGGSRMFLNRGDDVTVSELLFGLMVASGNDAAEALAEAVAGTPGQFIDEMNAAAARLGLHDTHFVTPHGLPAPGEYTTAYDAAVLARRILVAYSDAVLYSSPRYVTYAGIRQANWNNLVFRDPRVDGLKTGHTAEAGFSIVATARQGGMRLIAVVLEAPTLRQRTALAERLLDEGFAGYALAAIPWQTIVPSSLPVYGGTAAQCPLEAAGPVQILLRRDARAPLDVVEEIGLRPLAPLRRGQQAGLLTVRRQGSVILTVPLLAAATIERGGALTWAWGLVRYAVNAVIHPHRGSRSGTYTPHG